MGWDVLVNNLQLAGQLVDDEDGAVLLLASPARRSPCLQQLPTGAGSGGVGGFRSVGGEGGWRRWGRRRGWLAALQGDAAGFDLGIELRFDLGQPRPILFWAFAVFGSEGTQQIFVFAVCISFRCTAKHVSFSSFFICFPCLFYSIRLLAYSFISHSYIYLYYIYPPVRGLHVLTPRKGVPNM